LDQQTPGKRPAAQSKQLGKEDQPPVAATLRPDAKAFNENGRDQCDLTTAMRDSELS
jgi:hypothetical protein